MSHGPIHISGPSASGFLASIEAISLNADSTRLCAALVAACDYRAALWQRGSMSIPRIDEALVDGRFVAILADLAAFTASPDYVVAVLRVEELWSLACLRYTHQSPGVTDSDIKAALVRAQIAACWAAGDGDKV